jgi:hypothetical protein
MIARIIAAIRTILMTVVHAIVAIVTLPFKVLAQIFGRRRRRAAR